MSNENDTVNVLARRIENLPKWAQDHVNRLQREVERARAQVKQVHGEVENPSETTFIRGTLGGEDVPLDKFARVVFKVDNGEIRAWVDEQGLVNIMSSAYMGGDLIIRPRVSNVVTAQIWEF